MLTPDIRRLVAGDLQAWDMAYHLLWPIAYAVAHGRLRSIAPAAVEDVAIESIADAAKAVSTGNVESFEKLRAIVAVIANRTALDHIRRIQAERRSTGATESIEGREELVAKGPGPLENANAQDVAAILVAVMSRLPANHRELLKAYLLEGLKQRELAERFKLSIGTVGVTLSRALKSVREQLQKYPTLMKELSEALR